jgi:cytochrome oxidase Cu insertion factor (SCO1/SenC/PrrC family)
MKLHFASLLACAALVVQGDALHASQSAVHAQAASTGSTQSPSNPLPIKAADVRGANYFPNCELVTHEGRKVKYFDDLLAGKTVVVNFIYTTCPDACPMATAKLAEVQELFKDRMGKDVHFYSISVDPEVDTPEVLAKYAKRFNAGPGWLFLTGAKSDIREVRKKMGMLRADEENKEQHTLDMLIGNQSTGVWVKRSTMDNPYSIANQIEGKALGWKTPRAVEAETIAPRVRKYEEGEDIFRSRCSVCHIVGKDDGLPKQGPNLLGVVDRRDRKWLERWILEPDVMLALKDPLAMDLYNAWHQLPMPNLRLTPLEVDNVIGYMDRASDAYIAELEAKRAQAASDWDAPDTSDEGAEPSDEELLAPLGAKSKAAGCCKKTDGLVGDDAFAGAPADAAPAVVVAAPPVAEPAPAKGGCCKSDEGLLEDVLEQDGSALDPASAASRAEAGSDADGETEVPPCCREDELVEEPATPERAGTAPKSGRDKLPYPVLATGVLGLACVGLLGLLRLGKGAA